MSFLVPFILALIAIFLFGPRPRLKADNLYSQVPDLPIEALDNWLAEQEASVDNLVPGTEAHIEWADPANPGKTDYCFLYLHGFSATWEETAPVTSKLAETRKANVLQGRLKGHGQGSDGMLTESEHWCQSVLDQFDIASRIGDKVIIVATSTGATLTAWLLDYLIENKPLLAEKIHACLFMSPNFRIRNPFGFLLTWPWSPHWVRFVVGKEHAWEAESEAQARVWTNSYSSRAVIEMQKVVDYAKKIDYSALSTPVAIMYMVNDSTIYPPAAIDVFNRWGSKHKQLIKVEPNGDAAEHVFVGDITNPERNDWCIEKFNYFLDQLESSKRG